MTEDRRALLQSIAFGGDRSIKAAERLRALELLDGNTGSDVCFCADVAGLDPDELHDLEDRLLAGLFIARDDEERRRLWPHIIAAIDAYVAGRTATALRERTSPC